MGILGTTSNVLTKLKMDIKDHKAKLKTVKGLEKERYQAQHDQMEATNAGLDRGITRLGKYAVAVGVVTGAVITLKRGFEAYSERQRVLAAGAGKNLDSLRKSSLGLVTDTKLLRFEASLLNSKFKLTGEQMNTVMSGVMSLRKQFGDLDLTIEEVTKAFVEVDAGGLKRFSIGLEGAAGSQEIFLKMLKEMREQSKKFDGDMHVAGDSAKATMVALTNKTETLSIKMGRLGDRILPGLVSAMGGLIDALDSILKGVENIAAEAGKWYFGKDIGFGYTPHKAVKQQSGALMRGITYPGYKLRQGSEWLLGKADKLLGINQPKDQSYDEAVAVHKARQKKLAAAARKRETLRISNEAAWERTTMTAISQLQAYLSPDFVSATPKKKRKKISGSDRVKRAERALRKLGARHGAGVMGAGLRGQGGIPLTQVGTGESATMELDFQKWAANYVRDLPVAGGILGGGQFGPGWTGGSGFAALERAQINKDAAKMLKDEKIKTYDEKVLEQAAKISRAVNDNFKLIAEGVGIQTLKVAFESMTDSILASFDAWMDGSLNAAAAFKDMWRGMLKTIASMALTESLINTAKGFAQMAVPDPLSKYSASQYFKSAALWAGVATIAGGSAYLTRDTSSAPATSASIQRGSGGQGRTQTIIIGSDFEGDTPRNRAHRLRDILSYADKSGSSSVVEFG